MSSPRKYVLRPPMKASYSDDATVITEFSVPFTKDHRHSLIDWDEGLAVVEFPERRVAKCPKSWTII